MNEGKPVRPIRRDELRKFKNIVVVFGSRKFENDDLFDAGVRGFNSDHGFRPDNTVFLSGMAKGPDLQIVEWCKKNGWRWSEFPADWDNIDVPGALVRTNARGQYNARAGFTRNQDMANVATHGLGFWDGVSGGTKDMVERCNAKKINLRIIRI